jgi:Spy/CpxP family protein refolding chaperone
MTDTQSQTPPAAPGASNQQGPGGDCRYGSGRRCGRRRGKFLVLVAVLGSFLAGGFIFCHVHAIGQERYGQPWMHHVAMTGPGADAERAGGPPPEYMSPAERLAHGRDMVDRALTGADASSDQRTKILAIFDDAAKALKDAPASMFTTRLQIATLLTAPTVDHDKLEALRAARVAEVDADSKIVVKAVTDAADILTPDQRVKLAMFVEHFRPAPPPR